mmetsp:Transcript_89187/g.266015  ORF Transcript_89187/g.266015 Transcript_89187/m.266015 type:complete len:200 (+) Transcript_89187:771-1370(+)
MNHLGALWYHARKDSMAAPSQSFVAVLLSLAWTSWSSGKGPNSGKSSQPISFQALNLRPSSDNVSKVPSPYPPFSFLNAGMVSAIAPWRRAMSGTVRLKMSGPHSFVASNTTVSPARTAREMSSTSMRTSRTGLMPSSSRPSLMRCGKLRSSDSGFNRSSKLGRAAARASRSVHHCHSLPSGPTWPGTCPIHCSIPLYM